MKTPLYSPQSNGLVERMNRNIKEKIKENANGTRTLREVIEDLLFAYRMTPQCLTGVSPFEMLFSRKQKEPLSAFYKSPLPRTNLDKRIAEKLDKVRRRVDVKRGAQERIFEKGDLVKIKMKDGRYSDPIRVREQLTNSVKLEDGTVWPKRRLSLYERIRKGEGECGELG